MTIKQAAVGAGLTMAALGRLMTLDRTTLNRWNKQSKAGKLPQWKRDAVNAALRRHVATKGTGDIDVERLYTCDQCGIEGNTFEGATSDERLCFVCNDAR